MKGNIQDMPLQSFQKITDKTILALDTATRTGWAVAMSPREVRTGVVDFHQKSSDPFMMGRRFDEFDKWLNETIILYKPAFIFYEAIVGGITAGGKTSLVEKGLEALLLRRAYRHEIVPFAVYPATIKKWATGNGCLSKTGKVEMCSAAVREDPERAWTLHKPTKSQPWSIDDNEVDAFWLLSLACRLTYGINLTHDDDVTKIANLLTKEKWR